MRGVGHHYLDFFHSSLLGLYQIGDYLHQLALQPAAVGALGEDGDDGVVAGNGSQYLYDVTVVYVVGYRAGVARPCLDDGDVVGVLYRYETRCLEHLLGGSGTGYALVHGLVGQYVDILAVHARCLGYLEQLHVAAQGGLGHFKTLSVQFGEDVFLAAELLAGDEHLESLDTVFLSFHDVYIYTFTGAKLHKRCIFAKEKCIKIHSQCIFIQ